MKKLKDDFKRCNMWIIKVTVKEIVFFSNSGNIPEVKEWLD